MQIWIVEQLQRLNVLFHAQSPTHRKETKKQIPLGSDDIYIQVLQTTVLWNEFYQRENHASRFRSLE